MTNERAIQWLEMYANRPIKWDEYSDETKEIREEAEKQIAEAFRMAIKALSGRKRRMLPLDELWEINMKRLKEKESNGEKTEYQSDKRVL